MIALGVATAARANYYDSPRELDVMGSYTQAASGMVFPESVAGFTRSGIVRYNSEGTDESADYLLDVAGKEIGISVYVYPVPADLGSELAKVLPQADLIGALSMLVEQLFADEEQGVVEVHSGICWTKATFRSPNMAWIIRAMSRHSAIMRNSSAAS